MNMNVRKTNGVKLLAAVMVMAMVFVGASVILSDSEVNAAPATDGLTDLTSTQNGTNWEFTPGTKTLALKGVNLDQGFYYDGDLTITVAGDNTITDSTTAVAGTSAFAAIYATGSITIQADDSDATTDKLKITVNEKTTGSGGSEWTYGIYAGDGLSISGIAVDITVATEDKYAFAIRGNGSATTFSNVTGTIDGGNRAIQMGTYSTLTFSGCNLTLTGSEKAIQSKMTGGKIVIEDNSIINAKINPSYAGSNTGEDDGFAIKAVNISVDNNSMLNTDGMRVVFPAEAKDDDGKATLNGNVVINDYVYGNAEKPEIGFTVDSKTTVTVGDGSNAAKLTINSVATLDGDLTISGKATAEINNVVDNNADLTNGGSVINNGALVLKSGATFENNGTFSGNTVSAVSADQIVKGENGNDVPYLVAGGDDNLGLKGTLEADYTVPNLNYLSDNLVIKEGVTLTIASKGSFDLNGHSLTVNGNLVIERNGKVTAVAGGSILLGAKGTIQNAGVIGADSNVTVAIDPNSANIVAGEVTLKNVTGMTFGITKTVSGDKVTNTLTVGGSVTAKGVNPAVTIDGANVTGEFSVNNLAMTIGDEGVNVLRNATFSIQSKATVTGTGDIRLAQNGATVVINGNADVAIVAETGEYKADDTDPSLTATIIDVANVKGLTVTTGQYSYVDDSGATEVTKIVKTMVMSGTLTEVNNSSTGADGSIDISAVATGDNVGVTVSGTLNVDETVVVTIGAPLYVTGTIVSDEDLTTGTNADYINGTAYQVQTTDSTGATDDTYYITTFENAFAQVQNALEKTITVFGTVEVTSELIIPADVIVAAGANASIVVDENAKMTIQEEGTVDVVVTVNGILYCEAYSSYADPVGYAAMSEDDDGNVTYAGLRAAINNAQEGDVVQIVKDDTVKESLTIPAGITVEVASGVTLTFEKDLTIQEGAKVVNEGTINMSATSKLTVYGELDSTEGTVNGDEVLTPTASKTAVYSTGTITIGNNGAIAEAVINAAYYTDDDNNKVITSAAKAAAAVAQKDVGKTMNLSGTFSESGDFTADGIEITVDMDAKVSLGAVTLDDSKIGFATTGGTNAGVLTATVTAQTGADGSTTASTIAVSEINGVTIQSDDKIGSDNVTSWYLYLYGANPVGKYTVSAGTVTLGTTNAATIGFDKENTLTVASGATVVVPVGITLTAGAAGDKSTDVSVKVEGTLDVIGTFTVTGYVYVTGTVDIEKAANGGDATVNVAGTLQVAGTVNVSEEQDIEGTLEVAGALVLGDAPTTLGATGTVTGPVDLDGTGYVKVYAGSVIDAGKIAFDGNESKAVNTVFHINGTLYMTVYAAEGTTEFKAVLEAEKFEITGYDTSGANSPIIGADEKPTDNYAWYPNADYTGTKVTTTTDIGAEGYENVYFQASIVEKPFTVSVGPGISLYIDGIRHTGGYVYLGIGTYTVEAIVDPGYTGTTTITFNGQTVTGGTITVTADMVSDAYQGQRTIAASGAISQDSTVVVDGGSSGDSGMGLTDYLLIILVVLIVVMAIIVAMRLMRS